MGTINASQQDWKREMKQLGKEIREDLNSDKGIKKERREKYIECLNSPKLELKEPILYRKIALVLKQDKDLKVGDFKTASSQSFEARVLDMNVEDCESKTKKIRKQFLNTFTKVSENSQPNRKKRVIAWKKIGTIAAQATIGAVVGGLADKVIDNFSSNSSSELETNSVQDKDVAEINEKILELKNSIKDNDLDNLPNGYEEEVLGTDISKIDTDGDTINDNIELANKTNPTIPNEELVETVGSSKPIVKTADNNYEVKIDESSSYTDCEYRSIRTILSKDYFDKLGINSENLTDQAKAKVLWMTDYIADRSAGTNEIKIEGSVIDAGINKLNGLLESNPNYLSGLEESAVNSNIDWNNWTDIEAMAQSFGEVKETMPEFTPSESVAEWKAEQSNNAREEFLS